MKKITIVFMLCVVSLFCYSQEVKVLAEQFPLYQGVVTTNLPAATLYTQSKIWIAEAFRSAQDVIQYDNADDATILIKGNTDIGTGFKQAKVHFTLKIEGKENRFRYTLQITDVTGTSGEGLTMSVMSLYLKKEKYGNWVTDEIRPLLNQWIENILATQTNSENNDW